MKDIGQSGAAYTVSGTLLSCEDFDRPAPTRNPLDDFYEDCQCQYTIKQENNRVLSIQGGTTQTYTVEFQEVVRRKCGGQEVGEVVHRDTLTKTAPIRTSRFRQQLGFSFAPGQFVTRFNLRAYNSGPSIISVELDPNTVQSTYPSLTLDPADFTFNGSNIADMAAAYHTVLTHAISQAVGTPVNNINAEVSFGSSTGINIFHELLHEPTGVYVIQPRPGDADYLVGFPFSPIVFGIGSPGETTRTNDYTEECETIWETRSGSYMQWDQNIPFELVPRLMPAMNPFVFSGDNLSTFCDVPPAICAALAMTPVEIDGCVEICSDVMNIAGHQPVANETVTLDPYTYNSVSIFVTQGPVGVTLDGQRIDYPTGWSTAWRAQEGKLLMNSIAIDAAGGQAVVSYVK